MPGSHVRERHVPADLEIGMEVEVDLQVLFTDEDGVDKWVWTWAPAAPKGDDK